MEGEVDLRAELISALEELRKTKKKNKQLRTQLSVNEEEKKYKIEESNRIISKLPTRLQEVKKIEEDLELQLKKGLTIAIF